MSAVQIRIVPRVAGMIPARHRSVVVFPAPFGPTNPSTCPDPTVNESSFTATNSPYSLVRASTSIIDAATDGAQTSGDHRPPSKLSKAQSAQATTLQQAKGGGASPAAIFCPEKALLHRDLPSKSN